MDYLTPEDYAIAKENGISKRNLDQRFYMYGWSKERAITKKPVRKGGRAKFPPEIKKLAMKNDINDDTFYYRIKAGYTPEEAATIPVGMGQRYRKHPRKWIDLAEKNEIPYDVFNERVEAGVPYEVAATRPLQQRIKLPREA